MPALLRNDIRHVIIYQRYGLQKSCKEIAALIYVSRRTVERICNRFENYGTIEPEPIGPQAGFNDCHPYCSSGVCSQASNGIFKVFMQQNFTPTFYGLSVKLM